MKIKKTEKKFQNRDENLKNLKKMKNDPTLFRHEKRIKEEWNTLLRKSAMYNTRKTQTFFSVLSAAGALASGPMFASFVRAAIRHPLAMA